MLWVLLNFSTISAYSASVFRVQPESILLNKTPGGSLETYKNSIQAALDQCNTFPKNKTWDLGDRKASKDEWCNQTHEKMIALVNESKDFEELWEKSKSEFDWYQSVGDNGQGSVHYTGYYLPRLKAKRTPDAEFRFPIYSRPQELTQATIGGKLKWGYYNSEGVFGPYFSRYEIDWLGALTGKDLEIAYTNDFIKLFFVHIQGSGAVEIVNDAGEVTDSIFVNYDSQNGHTYVPIGRILRDEGMDSSQISMQGIVKFFEENPFEIGRLIPLNPSFIFFREQREGPFGAIAVKLTDEHSVAIDRTHYPLGSLALISTEVAEIHDGQVTGFQPWTRFVMSQDVGGAIMGAGRVDIYFGHDEDAELTAGIQSHRGTMYFPIIPKKQN